MTKEELLQKIFGFKEKRVIHIAHDYFSAHHPEGLYCPICGCGEIPYWPELEDWDNWDDDKKAKFEICMACGYGGKDFPYEHF